MYNNKLIKGKSSIKTSGKTRSLYHKKQNREFNLPFIYKAIKAKQLLLKTDNLSYDGDPTVGIKKLKAILFDWICEKI